MPHQLYRLWIPASALLLAGLLSFTGLHQWVDYWLRDHLQALTAGEHYFSNTLLLDINDTSLKQLEPHIGTWPYPRDVYANLLDYLNGLGVQQVVFDILFSEARDRDERLRDALVQHGNVVLVAGVSQASLSPADRQRLDALSWRAPEQVPAKSLGSLLLPRAEITGDSTKQRIGIISAASDADGILRRLPMLYRIEQRILPALPLRTLIKTPRPTVSYQAESHQLRSENLSLPVDAQGQVALYFPRNPNSVLSLPFHQVMEAALGLRRVDDTGQLFQGKTVFIGSTAYLSDRVTTPRGAMSGTYALAIAHETLAQGLIIRPDRPVWNGLLILLALVPSLGYAIRRHLPLKGLVLMPLVSLVGLIALSLGLLKFSQQGSDLLLALESLIISTLLLAWYYQRQIKQQHSQLQEEYQELTTVANTDALTGLNNRRAFLASFERERKRLQRHGGDLPAVAIMDLDKFKSVNDTYGHDIGDIVLKIFANVLEESVRTIDIPGRWGGEEFVVLLPRTDVHSAVTVLERVRVEISQRKIPAPADQLVVTVSIGVAQVPDLEIDADQCIKLADSALYTAKETGRNRICIADPATPATEQPE
jgi:diguanylate cyclase